MPAITLWPDPQTAKTIAGYISLLTDIFLRLIKMIIAPLVFSTLVVGIAHMGDTKAIGRIGVKAMGWFVGASLVSLLLGMIMVNILRPGDNLNLPLPDADAVDQPQGRLARRSRSSSPTWCREAPSRRWPTNEILQIVVFSMFFGVAAAALGDKAQGSSSRASRSSSHVILKVTGYIMNARAARGVRRDGGDRHDAGPRHPGHLRQVHAPVLSRASPCSGAADRSPASCSSATRVVRLFS